MADGIVYTSGILAFDKDNNVNHVGDAEAQTRQVVETIRSIVETAGGAAGPEVSVFSFVTMAALTLVFHLLFPSRAPAAMPSRATAQEEAAPSETPRDEPGEAARAPSDSADVSRDPKLPSE